MEFQHAKHLINKLLNVLEAFKSKNGFKICFFHHKIGENVAKYALSSQSNPEVFMTPRQEIDIID